MGGYRHITHEIVSNPESLRDLLNNMAHSLEELRTLANELADDRTANLALFEEIEVDLEALHVDAAAWDAAIAAAHVDAAAVDLLANELRHDVNRLNNQMSADIPSMPSIVTPAAGIAEVAPANVDMLTAANVQTVINGITQVAAAVSPVPTTGGDGDTITQTKYGVQVIFAKLDGLLDGECTQTGLSAFASAAEAWAAYSHHGTIGTFMDVEPMVPIAAVEMLANVTAPFTWGTTALDADTPNYVDLIARPRVMTQLASLALDAGTSQFTYGAGEVLMGDGTRVTLAGAANFVSEVGTLIADGAVGLWVIYAGPGANTIVSKQLGAAYGSIAVAHVALEAMRENPMQPVIGFFTVSNGSGANWTMGTENFDDADIATAFPIIGPWNTGSFFNAGAGEHQFPKLTHPETAHTVDDTTHTVTDIAAVQTADPGAPNVSQRTKRTV